MISAHDIDLFNEIFDLWKRFQSQCNIRQWTKTDQRYLVGMLENKYTNLNHRKMLSLRGDSKLTSIIRSRMT